MNTFLIVLLMICPLVATFQTHLYNHLTYGCNPEQEEYDLR